jgi:hypothetical protein
MHDRTMTPREWWKWCFISVALAIPQIFVFQRFGEMGRGGISVMAVIVLVLSFRMFWHLGSHAWFWVLVIALIAGHVAIVAFVPWGKDAILGRGLAGAGLADFLIVYGIFEFAQLVFLRDAQSK